MPGEIALAADRGRAGNRALPALRPLPGPDSAAERMMPRLFPGADSARYGNVGADHLMFAEAGPDAALCGAGTRSLEDVGCRNLGWA